MRKATIEKSKKFLKMSNSITNIRWTLDMMEANSLDGNTFKNRAVEQLYHASRNILLARNAEMWQSSRGTMREKK